METSFPTISKDSGEPLPLPSNLTQQTDRDENLKNNLLKLKSRIIDTNSLINLFKKNKEELAKITSQLEREKKENENLRIQLEAALKETIPVREQLENAKAEIKDLKKELQQGQAQLKSSQSLNTQLRAELNDRNNFKEEKERMNKENQRLKKELQLKDDVATQLRRRNEGMSGQVKLLEEQQKEAMKAIQSLESRITDLQEQIFGNKNIQPLQNEDITRLSSDIHLDQMTNDTTEVNIFNQSSKQLPAPKLLATNSSPKLSPISKPTPTPKYAPTPQIITQQSKSIETTDVVRKELSSEVGSISPGLAKGKRKVISLPITNVPVVEDPKIKRQKSRDKLNGDLTNSITDIIPFKETPLDYITRELNHFTEENFDEVLVALSQDSSLHPHLITALQLFVRKSVTQKVSSLDEELLVCLIWHLTSTCDKDFLNSLLQQFSILIVMTNLSTAEMMCMSRLFTWLCKLQGNIERVRIMCFDLLRERSFIEVNVFSAVVSIWPEVLKDCDLVLMKTIETLVGIAYNGIPISPFPPNTPQHIMQQVQEYHSIKKLCGWKSIAENVEQLVDYILDYMYKYSKDSNQLYNAVKAMELLAVTQDWIWTYNYLIVGKLWPLLVQYPQNEDVIVAITQLLGVLGKTSLSEESDGQSTEIVYLRKRLHGVLVDLGNTFSFSMKVAAAQALMDISVGIPENLTPVKDWFGTLTMAQKSQLPSKLLQNLLLCVE